MLGRLIVVAALTAPISIAGSQGREPLRQPAEVPTELAVALASAGGFPRQADPQLLVGTVPEWFTNVVALPAEARMVGSAFISNHVVAVVSVPSRSDSVLIELDDWLRLQGWAPPPDRHFPGGGFREAPRSRQPRSLTRLTLCRDHHMLTGTSSRRTDGSIVTLRLVSGRGGACNPPEIPLQMANRPTFPTLYDPQDASRAFRECIEEFDGTSTSGTGNRLKTSMSAAELLEHYGRQLQDSGWAPVGLTRQTIAQSWSRPGSGGVARVTLQVSPMGNEASCHEISMEMRSSRMP